jgi:hypothetical protein
MTEIDGVGWPTTPRVSRRAPTSPGFSVAPEPLNTGQATAAAPAHASSLASVLSLQEFGGETLEDREARRHGHDMLAALSELQRALLGGASDAGGLERLAALAASVPRATDPRLAALVSAIVLRVQVELARRQR